MPEPLVSLVVPSSNEARTVAAVVRRAVAMTLHLEIVVVDDGSTDGTADLLESLRREGPVLTVLRHEQNEGKGAAVRDGIRVTTGDFVVIQDADLEYDPKDLPVLLGPLFEGRAGARDGQHLPGGGAPTRPP